MGLDPCGPETRAAIGRSALRVDEHRLEMLSNQLGNSLEIALLERLLDLEVPGDRMLRSIPRHEDLQLCRSCRLNETTEENTHESR